MKAAITAESCATSSAMNAPTSKKDRVKQIARTIPTHYSNWSRLNSGASRLAYRANPAFS